MDSGVHVSHESIGKILIQEDGLQEEKDDVKLCILSHLANMKVIRAYVEQRGALVALHALKTSHLGKKGMVGSITK
ncbi:MAG: hypothetical protein QW212_07975 [Nitrososphaerales archaeon]